MLVQSTARFNAPLSPSTNFVSTGDVKIAYENFAEYHTVTRRMELL
jgi:hypothetical protein